MTIVGVAGLDTVRVACDVGDWCHFPSTHDPAGDAVTAIMHLQESKGMAVGEVGCVVHTTAADADAVLTATRGLCKVQILTPSVAAVAGMDFEPGTRCVVVEPTRVSCVTSRRDGLEMPTMVGYADTRDGLATSDPRLTDLRLFIKDALVFKGWDTAAVETWILWESVQHKVPTSLTGPIRVVTTPWTLCQGAMNFVYVRCDGFAGGRGRAVSKQTVYDVDLACACAGVTWECPAHQYPCGFCTEEHVFCQW